jgi:hypothetical protein
MTIQTTKQVSLHQLQEEMVAAAVDVGDGLAQDGQDLFRCSGGATGDFLNEAAAQIVLDAHVAMRDKTDQEYSTEFQDAGTTSTRKQEIRDQMNGLLPREQVPM